MHNAGMGKTLVLIFFAGLCLACVAGAGFVLFDAVRAASGSPVQGLGAVAVFVMAVLFALRFLWQSRAR